eukprot:gene38302-51727_t
MKPTLLFLLLISGFQSFSQSTDTTTILYDYSWKVIENGYPAFFGRVWKEGNKWHKRDHYYPSGVMQMDGVYADKKLTVKDGLFTWYHDNGMMSDSCLYIGWQHEGTQITWDRDGNQTSIQHWSKNLPVDTAIWFNKEGGVTAVQITDSSGNGFYQQYLADGKTVQQKGALYNAKRTGKWFFRDNKGILGVEANYVLDSVISIKCFNEKGEPETSKNDCIVEKPAAFPGGPDGWRRYLERNLYYPDDAQKAGTQGIVRIQFTIDKDGSVSDVKILEAPSESLGRQGERLISKGPKWQPAIQYN